VQADKYAGQWVVEAFQKAGIVCEQSAEPKSVLYGALLPLLNSGRCELLDHRRLHAELCGLERRTTRGGRDSIDHLPGAHDDVANACAGALALAAVPRGPGEVWASGLAATPRQRADFAHELGLDWRDRRF
jgi:hypothetical protein